MKISANKMDIDLRNIQGKQIAYPKKFFERYCKDLSAMITFTYLSANKTDYGYVSFSIKEIAEFSGQVSRGKTTNMERGIYRTLIDNREIFFTNYEELDFGEISEDEEIKETVKKKRYFGRLNDNWFSRAKMINSQELYKNVYYGIIFKILNYKKFIDDDAVKKSMLVSPQSMLQFYFWFRFHRLERLNDNKRVDELQEVYSSYYKDMAEELNIGIRQPEKILYSLKAAKIMDSVRRKRTKKNDANSVERYCTHKIIMTEYKEKGKIDEFSGKENTHSSKEELDYAVRYQNHLAEINETYDKNSEIEDVWEY